VTKRSSHRGDEASFGIFRHLKIKGGRPTATTLYYFGYLELFEPDDWIGFGRI
jgi:hypothetical protein